MNLFGFTVSSNFAEKMGLDKNIEEVKKDLTWTPLPSGPEVWEEGKKKGEKIKEEINKNKIQEDKLSQMSWENLLDLRRNAKTKEEQNKIAPYEHRAYAREYVKDNPEAALVMPGLILGYNTMKAIGMKEGRSDASFKAVLEGMKGTIEGIGGKAKELFEE